MRKNQPINIGKKTWKELEAIQRHGYSGNTVFTDFLDLVLFALMSLNENMTRKDFFDRLKKNQFTGANEDEYKKIVGKYRENENKEIGNRPIDHFHRAWQYLQEETKEHGQDVLGEIFMTQISYGEHGQFFTPSHICDMMAQMVGNTVGEKVSDPCCGSGRFFISMGKVNKDLMFSGIDISPLCAKMTVLNMWMFDLNADIYLGDSLAMKYQRVWQVRRGGYLFTMDIPEKVNQEVKQQMK